MNRYPWVLREATVLGDRRGRWFDLRLVPVLCAGVDYQRLAADPHWVALNITRWQPVLAARCTFRDQAGQSDIAEIVDQVAAQLKGLAVPRAPAHERWTEEVRSFLNDLVQHKLKGRLTGAAQALRVKAPLEWDSNGLDQLARSLLQADVAEPDADGELRYPLPETLGQLIPGDPKATPLTPGELQFCQRLEPLAAPPGAAVAIGAAHVGAAGRPPPVLLKARNRRIAELAPRRASRNLAWVRTLSGVFGEDAATSEADLKAADCAVRNAALAKKPCFVVAAIQPVAGEDRPRWPPAWRQSCRHPPRGWAWSVAAHCHRRRPGPRSWSTCRRPTRLPLSRWRKSSTCSADASRRRTARGPEMNPPVAPSATPKGARPTARRSPFHGDGLATAGQVVADGALASLRTEMSDHVMTVAQVVARLRKLADTLPRRASGAGRRASGDLRDGSVYLMDERLLLAVQVSAIRSERCPPSAWNRVRHHRGLLSAMAAERRPGSR